MNKKKEQKERKARDLSFANGAHISALAEFNGVYLYTIEIVREFVSVAFLVNASEK